MNKESYKRKWASLATIIGVITVSLLLYTSVFQNVQIKEKEGTWHVFWQGSLAEAAEATPAAGASGFLEIFFVNHSATGTTAYDTNTSSSFETWADAALAAGGGNAWANADEFNLQLKHSVDFDIVVRCRFNATHAWNGTMFRDSDCRVNITASGGGVTILGTVSGTNAVSKNHTTDLSYIWINTYWNNSNAGYTLAKGSTCTISEISIQAKY